MKKLFRLSTALIVCVLLAGCTLINPNKPEEIFNPGNVQADPVKTGDGKDGDVTDVKDKEEEKNTVVPSSFEVIKEYSNDNCSYFDHLTAYDDKGNVLWVFDTGEIMIAQCDASMDIGVRESGYYYIADQILYCLDILTGEVKWKSDVEVGNGNSYDFDENDTIYLCGYFGPELVIIDKNGKTVAEYKSLKDPEGILDDFYWLYDIDYEDGKVRLTYENQNVCVIADPLTGEGRVEEFDGNADWSKCATKTWEMTNWTCSDGRDNTTCGDTYELEISEDYVMSLTYTDEDGNVQEFSYMTILFRPFDLYEGISDYYYGVWSGECCQWGDPYNTFAFQMSDPDTLELMWFTFDEDGNPSDYTHVSFMDAEILQYYHDVLELRNSNKN